MAYDYIRNYYGIDVVVGVEVQHTVTGRYGKVRPEGRENRHYVRVLFAGDRRTLPCHPEELDFIRAGAA